MNTYRTYFKVSLFIIGFLILTGFTSYYRTRVHNFNRQTSANIESMIEVYRINVSRETY